jgi:hypothetical protein
MAAPFQPGITTGQIGFGDGVHDAHQAREFLALPTIQFLFFWNALRERGRGRDDGHDRDDE